MLKWSKVYKTTFLSGHDQFVLRSAHFSIVIGTLCILKLFYSKTVSQFLMMMLDWLICAQVNAN